MRERRPNGFFNGMSDKELLNYTWRLHGEDVTRGKLYEKDSNLYNKLIKIRALGFIGIAFERNQIQFAVHIFLRFGVDIITALPRDRQLICGKVFKASDFGGSHGIKTLF